MNKLLLAAMDIDSKTIDNGNGTYTHTFSFPAPSFHEAVIEDIEFNVDGGVTFKIRASTPEAAVKFFRILQRTVVELGSKEHDHLLRK